MASARVLTAYRATEKKKYLYRGEAKFEIVATEQKWLYHKLVQPQLTSMCFLKLHLYMIVKKHLNNNVMVLIRKSAGNYQL